MPHNDVLLERLELSERPFSAIQWREVAGQKISDVTRVRLPMVPALTRLLNAERPDRSAVLTLLGPDEYEAAFGNATVYIINHPEECWADLYCLVVNFERDGSFKNVRTSCD